MKARKPKLPPEQKRSIPVMAYVTPDEYAKIKTLAEQTGLTISEYIRRTSLGHRIESRVDQKAIADLLKLKAELAKQGGLFKLALQQHQTNSLMGIAHKYSQLEARLLEKITAL